MGLPGIHLAPKGEEERVELMLLESEGLVREWELLDGFEGVSMRGLWRRW
jgi:hypothetical protein